MSKRSPKVIHAPKKASRTARRAPTGHHRDLAVTVTEPLRLSEAIEAETVGVLELLAPYAGGPVKPWVTDHRLRHHAERYQATKNPIFAWEALPEALGAERPLPSWTTDYLGRVATQMQALSRTDP